MKKYVRFLFVVTCIVCVGCASPTADDVDAQASVNSNTKELQSNLPIMEQRQKHNMTIREKQRVLLLKQDYQGALNLMSQYEKEIYEEMLQDKEFREKGESKEDTRYAALYTIRSIYSYLYQALGRDEEALQRIKEFELPTTTNPELLYLDCWEKFLLLGRLNMVDEATNEINMFFNNPNISEQSLSPKHHVMMMSMLISIQLVKGDIVSAKKNIYQLRDNIQRWPISNFAIQQEYTMIQETLLFVEHYINNLTETHTMHCVRREWKPPIPSPDDPKKVELDSPGVGFECVSRTDGSPFTIDDFRKIQAEQLRLQDPFLQPPPPPPQHLEDPFSLPSSTPQ